MEFQKFKETISANIEEDVIENGLTTDVATFVQLGEILAEGGFLPDVQVCEFAGLDGAHGRISGFFADEHNKTVGLIVFHQVRNFGDLLNPDNHELRASISNLRDAATYLKSGQHARQAGDGDALADALSSSWLAEADWVFYLITNAVIEGQLQEKDITAFDIQSVYRAQFPENFDQITMLGDYGLSGGIEYLRYSDGSSGNDVYLTLIPGTCLARLYQALGDQLMQTNVRSFLQLTGKVNKGIVNTIRDCPELFLSYNNGISATAESVKIENQRIVGFQDLQIVNGGQTTATLHAAMKKGMESKLDTIMVQAKITVINDHSRLLDLAPRISLYANSQNKVAHTDLAAGNHWHIRFDRKFNQIYSSEGYFFERSRGAYVQNCRTSDVFRKNHPRSGLITKVDVSKAAVCIEGYPHVACLGAEKCHQFFLKELSTEENFNPDLESTGKLLLAAVKLIRSVDRCVKELNLGGYKSQVVYYTSAILCESLAANIQHSDSQIKSCASAVREALLGGAGSVNVSEWAKRAQCWEIVKSKFSDFPSFDNSSAITGVGVSVDLGCAKKKLVDAGGEDFRKYILVSVYTNGPMLGMALVDGLKLHFEGRYTAGVEKAFKAVLKEMIKKGDILGCREFDSRGAELMLYRFVDQSLKIGCFSGRNASHIPPSEVRYLMQKDRIEIVKKNVVDFIKSRYGFKKVSDDILNLSGAVVALGSLPAYAESPVEDD
jgi:hypothetical protein